MRYEGVISLKERTSIWKKLLVWAMVAGVLFSSLVGVYFGFKGLKESEQVEYEQAQIEQEIDEEEEILEDEEILSDGESDDES